ncbi:MAG: SDR family NAD(P)-dependent oxidoreductase [Gemmatimonadaceae bacterium]|nr:SDR family NAD(P)-dependent oxidoreductase [Gemmatimonadaceae bacterium]
MNTNDLLQRALDEIVRQRTELAVLRAQRANEATPIAVVGLGCRFPGNANTPHAFWSLLDEARDATVDVPTDRWAHDPAASSAPAVRRGGFLARVDEFDAGFFGISPREARTMDPQQRMLLETAWHALEDAGIAPPSVYGSSTGVFVGVTCFDHAVRLADRMAELGPYAGTGSALNMIPGRLAFLLGACGPAMAVDTACSSSLVAVHLACRSLRDRECDMALAGGVQLMLSPEVMASFAQAHMLSPDGRCKTFDAQADGYARGEGCGVVVLRRLDDAEAAGDRILGIIRGSAVNQDGPSGGLTVPSSLAQAAVIRRALEWATVSPADVDYVEAHGTGTALGDPIEIEALAHAYGPHRSSDDPLLVGSVKTNIGHLEPAAGMASLAKVLLAFAHARIPAHRQLTRPNPHIAWADLPIRIVTEARPWPTRDRPARAGISAFGFSGTNAHLIVEAAHKDSINTKQEHDSAINGANLLCLSAKTPDALQRLAAAWVGHLGTLAPAAFGAACWTSRTGRAHFAHRLAVVAPSPAEARAQLAAWLAGMHHQCVHGVTGMAAYDATVREATASAAALLAGAAGNPGGLDGARLQALGTEYARGAEIDWRHDGWQRPGPPVSIPLYPFATERHSLEDRTADRPADRAALKDRPEPAAHLLTWEPVDTVREPGAAGRRLQGREVLVVGDDAQLCSMLIGEAARRGGGVRRPADADGIDATACTDVIVLPAAATDTMEGHRVTALLQVAHAVLAAAGPVSARLWVVTRGVAPVAGDTTRPPLVDAACAAAARGVSLEHPAHAGRVIDLGPASPGADDVSAILDELEQERPDDIVAVRDGQRLVPRLRPYVPASPPHESPNDTPPLRADRSYLVTGGLGALGLHVAEALADAGARRLLLLGRRGTGVPDAARDLRLQRLSDRGVTVVTLAADVAEASALRHALARHDDPALPLGGVFHAAGVGGMQPVQELDVDAVHAVLRPKLLGAWALHEVTRDAPLEHFVLFSSIAGVWGSRGQMHYAAANAALDALAHHRHHLGLPALSISWGPWEGSGMSSADDLALLERIGVYGLPPVAATAWLRRVMQQPVPHLVISATDWTRFRGSYEARGPRGLLAALPEAGQPAAGAPTRIDAPVVDAPLWPRTVLAASPAERTHLVETAVTDAVRHVLGWPSTTHLPLDQGLFELGVDSLAALDLRTQLEQLLGQSLPATLIFEYPTVAALIGGIEARLPDHAEHRASSAGTAPTAPIPRAPRTPPPTPARALLDEVSDDEAEQLLRDTLDALDLPT